MAKPLKNDSLDTLSVESFQQPKDKFKDKIKRVFMGSSFKEFPMSSINAFEEQDIHKNMKAESGLLVKHNV